MFLKVQTVRSLLEFEELLTRHSRSLEGKEWIKSPGQLYGQIEDGESVLGLTKKGELIQFTWRSQAQVYRTRPDGIRQRLVECRREINGMSMKPKKTVSVSEKIWIWRNETHKEAILRCFHEELGIEVQASDVLFKKQFLNRLNGSSSFPLRSKSCIFLYEYEIPFVHSCDFYVETRERKITQWKWENCP